MATLKLPCFVKDSRNPGDVGFYEKDSNELNEQEKTFVAAVYDDDFNLKVDDTEYAKAASALFCFEREVGDDYTFEFTQRDELTQTKSEEA